MKLGEKYKALKASERKPRTTRKIVNINVGLLKDTIAPVFYALSLIDDNVEIVDIHFPNLTVKDGMIQMELVTKKEVYKTKANGKAG